jgi:hypothetical protein
MRPFQRRERGLLCSLAQRSQSRKLIETGIENFQSKNRGAFSICPILKQGKVCRKAQQTPATGRSKYRPVSSQGVLYNLPDGPNA